MKTRTKVIITTVVLGFLTFMMNPESPWGGFWPPAPDLMAPAGFQVPLLMLLAIVEALMFGLGMCFLFFGYGLVHALAPASRGLSRAAHLAISWSMFTWWPHDSLHIHNGMNLNGLIVIDYCFHMTLIASSLIVAYFFITIMRAPATQRTE